MSKKIMAVPTVSKLRPAAIHITGLRNRPRAHLRGMHGSHPGDAVRRRIGPVRRRKETNRGLQAGGTDHYDCGIPGRGEGNDGERGDELYVGEINKKPGEAEKKEEKASKGVDRSLLFCV